MHHLPILPEILMVFAVALPVTYIFRKLQVPTLVGFLLSGIVLGPMGFGLITDMHNVEVLAEIGVILLLFTIGIEFSLKDLVRLRFAVFGAGTLQVVLTGGCVAVVMWLLGFTWPESILMGCLASLSSTAIVLTLLKAKGDIGAPHGQLATGILIFQDLAAIPMLMVAPMLASGGAQQADLWWTLAGTLGLVVLLLVVAHFVYPWILERVVRTRTPELFTLTAILVALGTAFLVGEVGLTLAIGAFLAGIVVSESPYAGQLLGEIAPLRDIFNTLFFVSVGLLVKLPPDSDTLVVIFTTVGIIVVVKSIITSGVAISLGFGVRIAVLAGVSLAQIGEFAFVLAKVGADVGLLSAGMVQIFLAVSVLSMLLTPATMALAHPLSARADKVPWLERLVPAAHHMGRRGESDPQTSTKELKDHVIIVGYGWTGQSVARVLQSLGIQHIILETNPFSVRDGRRAGAAVCYGDATKATILLHAEISRAQALVVTIADAGGAQQIVAQARRLNPALHVLVRTRYLRESKVLYSLGAQDVVPEEFETSLALVARVLRHYGVSRHVAELQLEQIRQHRYELLADERPVSPGLLSLPELLASADVEQVTLQAGDAACNKTIGEIGLRAKTGATILVVQRNGKLMSNPDAQTRLSEADDLVLFGNAPQMARAQEMLRLGALSNGESKL